MNAATHPVRLWSPKGVNLLSFFFLAAGALLGYRNARALGDKKKAAASLAFMMAGLLLMLAAWAVPSIPGPGFTTAVTALFAGWILTVGQPLRKAVEQGLPDGYRKRSFLPWVALTAVLYTLVLGSLFGFFKPGKDRIAATVQSIYQEQWKSRGVLSSAIVNKPRLEKTGDDRWLGTMAVEQSGVRMDLEVLAIYDPGQDRVEAYVQQSSYPSLCALMILPSLLESCRERFGSGCVITNVSLTKQFGDRYEGTCTFDAGGTPGVRRIKASVDDDGTAHWEETTT